MPGKQEIFAIIDGNALLHRAFHALPPLTAKSGMMVNAVYGFALTFLKVLKEVKPAYLAVAFDTAAPTFRDELYEKYKAHRIKQPQELYDQIPLIKEMVAAFGAQVVECDGYEADDVIGTLAKNDMFRMPHATKMIVTGDMDALQLVDTHVEVYTFRKGFTDTVVYDVDAVKERYGFAPSQMVDYKALRGDPSDNIPGVKGIGEKTATALLKQFSTLERVYESVEKNQAASAVIAPGVLKKLIEGKKQALLSKKLATIMTEVPLRLTLDDFRLAPADGKKIVALFREWGFQSLVGKVGALAGAAPANTDDMVTHAPVAASGAKQGVLSLTGGQQSMQRTWEGVSYRVVDTVEAFESFIHRLKQQKGFVVDTETDRLDPFHAELLGLSISWKAGEAYYIPDARFKISDSSIKDILEDPKIEKYGHNVKYDLEVLRTHGINARGFSFDTMIASYLLNPGSRQHNLDSVVFSEFGYQMQPIEELIGKGKSQMSLRDVALEKVAHYSCEDADFTFRLVAPYQQKLAQHNAETLLREIEMPLIPILADMESAGVKIDAAFLGALAVKVRKELRKRETDIHREAGISFNINSPAQIKEILFERLKLPTAGLAKTKTGISTAAGELEKLKGTHAIIPHILEYRELFKLLSTYLEALPEQVDVTTKRIHTDYNQTVAATGRLSSTSPNLQNIPIRTPLGREIRKAFIAERGYRLVAADYSQIELRIAASLTGDPAMLNSFKQDEDIHRRTASNVLGVPYDQVTQEQRREAKTINFGILYGLGARGLAEGTGLSVVEAKDFIERYFRVHAGIKQYVEETVSRARECGYVETIFGRRRYLPEIAAEHQGLRAQAERMAINHPIQGTAADLIKKAMINLDKRLRSELNDEATQPLERSARILLQVHDELVLEVKADMVGKVSQWVKEEMEGVAQLEIPIEVHVGSGKNWGECK